jgi:hypothetical protein
MPPRHAHVPTLDDRLRILPVFRAGAIPPGAIFKIPQTSRSEMFVTEPLVERVREMGLSGCDFRQVAELGG